MAVLSTIQSGCQCQYRVNTQYSLKRKCSVRASTTAMEFNVRNVKNIYACILNKKRKHPLVARFRSEVPVFVSKQKISTNFANCVGWPGSQLDTKKQYYPRRKNSPWKNPETISKKSELWLSHKIGAFRPKKVSQPSVKAFFFYLLTILRFGKSYLKTKCINDYTFM